MKFLEARVYQSRRGLQLFASLWPGFSSRAYKLSLNSVEQRPLQPPFVTVSWQMLLGCLSQTHASLLPSALLDQMACFAFSHGSPWAALSPQLLEAQHHTGLYRSHGCDLHPSCQMPFSPFMVLDCKSLVFSMQPFFFFMPIFFRLCSEIKPNNNARYRVTSIIWYFDTLIEQKISPFYIASKRQKIGDGYWVTPPNTQTDKSNVSVTVPTVLLRPVITPTGHLWPQLTVSQRSTYTANHLSDS